MYKNCCTYVVNSPGILRVLVAVSYNTKISLGPSVFLKPPLVHAYERFQAINV